MVLQLNESRVLGKAWYLGAGQIHHDFIAAQGLPYI
jgi:hypothetical protein